MRLPGARLRRALGDDALFLAALMLTLALLLVLSIAIEQATP